MTESRGFFKRMRKSSKKSSLPAKQSPGPEASQQPPLSTTATTPEIITPPTTIPASTLTTVPASATTTEAPPPTPPPPPTTTTTTESSADEGSLHKQRMEAFQKMDEELTRMRGELSRAAILQDKREMEAARYSAEIIRYKEELASVSAVKIETEKENRKLQGDVSSLERERARLASESGRLKEDLQRYREKLKEKKGAVADLKARLQKAEDEKEEAQKRSMEREQTWKTIRHDVSNRRDDAIKETCKLRRENEKLKGRVAKLRTEKSNILYGLWESKQREKQHQQKLQSTPPLSRRTYDRGSTESDRAHRLCQDEGLQAKVLSLELQLFRNARLVELLLDMLQTHDPQFTSQEREDLTAAFADTGSIPDLVSKKVTFA